MSEINPKIERGIPVPSPTKWKDLFSQMEVGDSFFVDGETSNSIYGAMKYSSKQLGIRIMVRAIDGGVRVWRTA